MYSVQNQPSYLPTFDDLALNGILHYDPTAYIYGSQSNLKLPYRTPYDSFAPQGAAPYGAPQGAPQGPYAPVSPQVKTKKTDNLLNKAGTVALAAAGAILTGAFLKKKFPTAKITGVFEQAGNYLKSLPSKVMGLFKKAKP